MSGDWLSCMWELSIIQGKMKKAYCRKCLDWIHDCAVGSFFSFLHSTSEILWLRDRLCWFQSHSRETKSPTCSNLRSANIKAWESRLRWVLHVQRFLHAVQSAHYTMKAQQFLSVTIWCNCRHRTEVLWKVVLWLAEQRKMFHLFLDRKSTSWFNHDVFSEISF